MADIVNVMDGVSLSYICSVLNFSLNENLTPKQQKKQYTNFILSHPEIILSFLPKNEIDLLLFIKAHREQTRGVAFANKYGLLLMEVAGVANRYSDVYGINRIRVADDFLDVALPLVADIRMSDEACERYDVEELIEGMANLYGEVTMKDVKHQLMMERGCTAKEVNQLIDKVMDSSILLNFIVYLRAEVKLELFASADGNIVFTARCRWAVPAELHKAIANHQPVIEESRHFTESEIREAGSGEAPIIPNARQKEFWNLLTRDLGLHEQEALQICYELW